MGCLKQDPRRNYSYECES